MSTEKRVIGETSSLALASSIRWISEESWATVIWSNCCSMESWRALVMTSGSEGGDDFGGAEEGDLPRQLLTCCVRPVTVIALKSL